MAAFDETGILEVPADAPKEEEKEEGVMLRTKRKKRRVMDATEEEEEEEREEDGSQCPIPSASSCAVDCLLVIDAVHDFLSPEGRFAAAFGEEDTRDITSLLPTLQELTARCVAQGVQVIAVSSWYRPKQFHRVPGVCSTQEGSKVLLEPPVKTIYKTDNSVLQSGSKTWLLEQIAHKRVMVAGVTTPGCVQRSVEDIKGRCAEVVVAKDAVAARGKSSKAVQAFFDSEGVQFADGWKGVVEAPSAPRTLHYVNGSVPSFRVQLLLHYARLPYKPLRIRVMRRPKPTRSAEFLAVNPRGQTPVFTGPETGGAPVRESLAILTFLAFTDGVFPRVPSGPELALMQETEKLRLLLGNLDVFYKGGPEAGKEVGIAEGLAALWEELGVWDGYARDGLLSPSSPSVADFALFPVLAFLVRRGMQLKEEEGRGHLARYYAEMCRQAWVKQATPSGWDTWDHTLRKGFNAWVRGVRLAAAVSARGEGSPAVRALVFHSKADLTAHLQALGPHGSSGTVPKTQVFGPDTMQGWGDADTPLRGLGAGDSSLLFRVLREPEAGDLLEQVKQEVQWHVMRHQGGDVPRLVAIQGHCPGGLQPVYRHPADEQPPLSAFTPTVEAIRHQVEAALLRVLDIPVKLNHALIQWYRTGEDYISPHADKTLDILRGTPIINVSLGATRSMTISSKKDVVMGSRRRQHVALPNNSVLVFGWESNVRCLHGVKQDKRAARDKREDEKAFGGERVSITFRSIATFLTADGRLYGQGAVCKTEDGEPGTSTSDPVELIRAFGQENRRSDFDWDAVYGNGFDCLNISVVDRS